MRRAVVLAAAVLVTAGCSSSSDDAKEPAPDVTTAPSATSTTPPPSPTPSPTPALVVRVVDPPDGVTGFRSPSGNIVCGMIAARDQDLPAVRCDVSQHSWALPPKPADCDLDWGAVATLLTGYKATMGECVSDAAPGGDVLPYDHALRVGDMQCASYRTGVECVDLPSGHRFFVSKASYRVS